MVRLSARFITPGRAAATAVALAPLVYFFPAVRGHLVLCPDDGWLTNLPLRLTVARELLNSQLPIWNPYIFSGFPLLGAAQAGVLFPLNWFFLFLSAPLAMNLAVLSTYALAGLGAYVFSRRSGASIFGSIITGVVWQWSGFFIAHIGHTNMIQTASLLPWVLWAIEGYAQTGKRSRALLIASLVAFQSFAGHPQVLAYSLLLAAAYAGFMALNSGAARRRYLVTIAMAASGLALSAVQILPTLELARNSVRADVNYEFFTSLSLPPKFFFTLFAPYLLGGGDGSLYSLPYVGPPFYGEYAGYVGVATLMLAIAAPFIKRNAQTNFWSGVALVSFALTLGQFWPLGLYRIVFHIPLLNVFRVPARHLVEVDFALAVLAGRAASAIPLAQNGKRVATTTVIVAASVLLLTCLSVALCRPTELRAQGIVKTFRNPEISIPIVMVIASAIALCACARRWEVGRVLMLVVVLVDLSLWGQFSGWRLSPPRDSALWQEPSIIAFLRQREGQDNFRVLSLLPPPDASVSYAASRMRITEDVLTLQPDTYMMYGVQNAAGYDTFGLERYSRLADDMKVWGELGNASRSLTVGRDFDLLNVRYLIAKGFVGDSSRWRLVSQFGNVSVYENLSALPRAWLATKLMQLPQDAMLNVIHSGKFADGQSWEPRSTALMDTPLQITFSGADVERNVQVVRYEPNRIDLRTACVVPSVLVLSENHYSGWRAYVDGDFVPTLRIDYNLRGVALSPGEHLVCFVYRPKSVLIGLLLSTTMVIALLLWCLRPNVRAVIRSQSMNDQC